MNQAILTIDQAVLELTRLRARRQRIVLTNGCFDLLHVGHVSNLRHAKAQGDFLIVAINDDRSVTRLKGDLRPILPLGQRAELLASVRWVDLVIPFGEDTAVEVVRRLKPDIYAKGGDYDLARTPEGIEVLGYGGALVSCPLTPGCSTTAIVDRIVKLNQGKEGKP